jgi:bacteriophage protein
MNVADHTSIFDRVIERMDKLSTWRFAAVWLIFFLLAAGYFLSVIKWW